LPQQQQQQQQQLTQNISLICLKNNIYDVSCFKGSFDFDFSKRRSQFEIHFNLSMKQILL
jgi:hypothetical protein